MKKIALALVALLFLVSVYFGFQAAAHLDGHLKKTAPNNSLEPISAQQNYLIFQVSELGGDSPMLVSVWGLFVRDAPPLTWRLSRSTHPQIQSKKTTRSPFSV